MFQFRFFRNKICQRAFLLLFLLILGIGMPSAANATVINQGSACYFTVNGNNYVKFEVNANTWGWISNIPGSVGNTHVTVKLFNASNTLIGTYTASATSAVMTINVGSVSGPYHLQAYVDVYQGTNTVFHADLEGDNGNNFIDITDMCDVPEPNGHVDGCFSFAQSEIGNSSLVKITLDPSFALFMAYHNYYPVLALIDGANLYGPFTAVSTSGNVVTFNVSAAVNLDPGKCYDAEIVLKDQNNTTLQQYSYDFRICKCDPFRRCAAEFKIDASDAGGGLFGLQCTTPSINNIASEYWTISSNNTVVWSGPMAVGWLLPYGGYTICHKVTTIYGETCEYCTDYCFTGNTSSNDGGEGEGNKTARPQQTKPVLSGKTSFSKEGSQLHVNYFSADDARINLAVYNSLGQVILQKNNVNVTKGANDITETMPAVSSGVYYLQVNGNNKSVTNKFTVE